MRLQLLAKITDAELLRKSMHELGTVFYQVDGDGNITRVVYFSGSRVVEFVGRVDEDLAYALRDTLDVLADHERRIKRLEEKLGFLADVESRVVEMAVAGGRGE